MQTQAMCDRVAGAPWLEHLSGETGEPTQTPLEKCPLTIGRSEAADLRIESNRVSREHAMFVHEGGAYRVKDLDSTNGTFLNGKRIKEAVLSDGDLVMLANVEFTFCCGPRDAPRNTATQSMEFASPDEEQLAADVIYSVRRFHEAIVHRCLMLHWQPIVHLHDGSSLGYEALGEGDGDEQETPEAARLVLTTDCRLAGRLRHLGRVIAAEEAAKLPGDCPIFVKLHDSEIGAGTLIESIAKAHALSAGHPLVVEMPYSAVCDVPYCRELRRRLHELGVRVACDGFAGGPGQVAQLADLHPEFIKLAKSVVRGIGGNQDRQRQVRAVVRAAREIGAEVIAVGIRRQDDAQICCELGCRLGQGPAYDDPQSSRLLWPHVKSA